MNENLIFFSLAEGNLLIRLLVAHFVCDFMLQTVAMAANKKWISKYMLIHVSTIFGLTALLTGNWLLAISTAVSHWLIDGLKYEAGKSNKLSNATLFIADQALHLISIILLWSFFSHNCHNLSQAIVLSLTNYKFSLILLGYILITTPVGYLIKHATQNINTGSTTNVQHGGKWIGIFERIIILTLVLLGQYEAIGFLITGKSIIRFASNDEHLRSEYVLVGTMMSYAFSILTGVAINYLLG